MNSVSRGLDLRKPWFNFFCKDFSISTMKKKHPVWTPFNSTKYQVLKFGYDFRLDFQVPILACNRCPFAIMNVVKLSRLHGVMALASNGAPKDRNTEMQDTCG